MEYLLELISDDRLQDVEPGSAIDDEMLKYLHDVGVREVKSSIKECRDATGKYASLHGACQSLISQAHLQCKRAYEWTLQVISRFRSSQLHLEGNLPAKEVSFKQFDPSGKVSVHEFLTLYEEWARGYISERPRPDSCSPSIYPPQLLRGLRRSSYPSMTTTA